MKNKSINITITILSILLFMYMMFISNIDLGTGKKELENILILVIPCIILYIDSLRTNNINNKKQYLYYYLIIYLIVLIGFTFSNNRLFYKRIDNFVYVREYNLIPFASIKELLTNKVGLKIGIYNIIGNFLMLTPFAILLPLLFNKFKKSSIFIPFIIASSMLIEIIQFITNTGSFDIDDIILNSIGAILLYLLAKINIINKLLYFIFYKITYKKKIVKILRIVLFISIFLIYVYYSIAIVENYLANIVDTSGIYCINNEKTFITRIGKYNYYSKCKYDGHIKIGGNTVLLENYVKDNAKQETFNDLGITKESWLTNIEITYNNNKLKFIDEIDNTKHYLLGLETIKLYIDYNNDNKINEISIDENNYNDYIEKLTTLKESGIINNIPYAIFEGEYYNIISCQRAKYITDFSNYIIPKEYKYDNTFCNLNN